MSGIDINKMAHQMAVAFVAENGPFYLSQGSGGTANISLPLGTDDVAETIKSAVVGGLAEILGRDFAVFMLCRCLDGEVLTDYGYSLIETMLEEVCDAAREMLADGRDPWAEISRMQAEQTMRAGS
ncbi:hypothetical protein ACK31H_20935 [Aeromonas caviae]